MKTRKVKVFAILVALYLVITLNIKAANISGNSNVKVGETFTLTFDFGTNVGAYDSINVSYDTNMYEYISGDSLNESVWWDQSDTSAGITSKTYTFKAIKEGSSRIAVVAKGVTSANEKMDNIGTVTAEKLITAMQPQQVVQPQSEPAPQPQPAPQTSVALSSNNFLKYVQLSEEGINPYFTRNITNYSLTVGEAVNSIDVLARAEDSNARVDISGNDNIVEGDNHIYITVTAQNGDKKTYTILVTKTQDVENSNAFLETLIVENYNLKEEFQSELLEYNIGDISNIVKTLNIVAIAKDERANIEILGADELKIDGEIVVKVTAIDGKTIREYKLRYNYVDATNDELSNMEMRDYLKEVQSSKNAKEKVMAYLKYLWATIRKNYLLVAMYALILFEFIQIVHIRRKFNKKINNDDVYDTKSSEEEKEILKVNLPKEEKIVPQKIEPPQITPLEDKRFETTKIEPPQMTSLKDENNKIIEEAPLKRHGSVKADGVKLVDLDKNEGPQDELTFNIFENLNDEDIKRLLNDEMDKD